MIGRTGDGRSNRRSYTTIVVGSGSAGCVAAARLSQDSNESVLVLEAGPMPEGELLDFVLNSELSVTESNWGWLDADRDDPLHCGKLVGGSSATGATAAVRGRPADYDNWATMTSNPEWSFERLLPLFRDLENDANFGDQPDHGRDGQVKIERVPVADLAPLQDALRRAALLQGHTWVEDHNARSGVGVGLWPSNGVGGQRQSAYLSHLKPAIEPHPRLRLMAGREVVRVLVDKQKAIGVEIGRGSPREEFFAENVILAAGTYGSPTILLRSGIGPERHLRHVGIPVVLDLPGVGHNLRDHPTVRLTLTTRADQKKSSPWTQVLLTARSGPTEPDFDLQIFCGRGRKGLREFFLQVGLMAPDCSGTLELDKDGANPRIRHALLSHQRDHQRLVAGVEMARKLLATEPFAALIEAEAAETATLSAARIVEEKVLTYFDPVGTCRMGLATDKQAVVDSHGKVHGIEGLWVMDASIMPTIPRANTNIPTMVLAERCARWFPG